MHFLEHRALSKLTALLNDLDVGDRLLHGRLELFSTAPEGSQDSSSSEQQQNQKLNHSKDQNKEISNSIQQNQSLNDSDESYSNFSEQKTQKEEISDEVIISPKNKRRKKNCTNIIVLAESERQLLFNLVTTMNTCFPDYDYSSLNTDAFALIEDFVTVYTGINYHLSFLAEKVIPGFLQDLWSGIRDAVNLREVSIYTYRNAKAEADPYLDDEGCLYSFDYFFVDPQRQRILFFTCVTKRKYTPEEETDIEESSGTSGDEFFRQKGLTIFISVFIDTVTHFKCKDEEEVEFDVYSDDEKTSSDELEETTLMETQST